LATLWSISVAISSTERSPEFMTVARAWIELWDQHRDHLVDLLGVVEYERRQRDRLAQLRAIDDGLLRRSLLAATRPG
jgi:hypothetical protein